MQDDPQKRELDNRRNFMFRLNLFFFIVFGLFSLLIVRLAVLQFVEGPNLSAAGLEKRTRFDYIPPIRGNIYDANGYPIAYSTSTQSLYYSLQPGNEEQAIEEAKQMAVRLKEVFDQYGDPDNEMSIDDIIRQMDLEFKRNIISTPRRIKSGLTNEELAFFMENKNAFTGIDIMEESVRNYDQNTIAVQLVGYLKKYKGVRLDVEFYKAKLDETDKTLKYLEEEEVGMDGLEYMYQDLLRGKNGFKTYPINNKEQIIGPMQITNPEKGADLYLTIDKNVQLKTEEAIMTHLEKIRNSPNTRYERAEHAFTGFAVAMEVDTGKVVAMASMPDYNPNIWAGGSISLEDYENFSNVLSNGTIRTVYGPYETKEERDRHANSILPPGSTLKPLSVLIGLNEGLFTTTQRYNDTGVFTFGKAGYERSIRNSQFKSFGPIDGAAAIAHSSNPFMSAMIGNALYMRNGNKGVEIWDEYMKQFGLGVSTESGLPNESKGVIEYFREAESGSAQSALIFASFGQQGRYTTLQLAQYTAMLANRGHRMKPQFVNEVRDADGNVIQSFEPVVLNSVDIREEYWKEIEEGMSKVGVQGFEGFQHSFRRKTGTSEQDVAGGRVENAVFIAYAPAENPKLAVAVVVPNGGFGGYGAAPIARQIFDAYDAEIGLTGVPNKSLQQQNAGTTGELTADLDGQTEQTEQTE